MKNIKTLPILFILMFATHVNAQNYEPLIWNASQIKNVKESLTKQEPTYKKAFESIVRQAESELLKPNPSVIDKSIVPPSGDKRDYISMGRYWWPNPDSVDGLPYVRRDGYSNPELKNYDRERLGKMCESVVTLAQATYFSGDDRYARKVVEILDRWFINPDSRMNPNMNFGQTIPGHLDGKGRAEGVLDTYSFVGMLDAILLLRSVGKIDEDRIDMLKKWFGDYVEWMTTSEIGIAEKNAKNNHGLAYDVQLAVFAYFAEKNQLAESIINNFPKSRLFKQIEPDGKQPLELARTTGFGYSVFNITHMLDMCDLAKNKGILLYDSMSNDGRSIEGAINYLIQFLGKQSNFPYKQIDNWNGVEHNFAEQLFRASKYSRKSEEYLKLFYKYKREDLSDRFVLLLCD